MSEFQFLYRPGHAKACRMTYANTKGADQTVHPHSLIIAFVVRCLYSMVYIWYKFQQILATVAFVADQSGLKQTRSTIPEDAFLRDGAHIKCTCTNLTTKKHNKNSTRSSCRCTRVVALKVSLYIDIVLLFYICWSFGTVGFNT